MHDWQQPVVLIIGTRPEGIKMAPVYFALKRAGIPIIVCSTMQHDQLLEEVLDLFDIVPDIKLDIMRPGQDLFYLTQSVLQKTKEFFLEINPALVLVQGDTTSSMAAALAAFYLGIPIGHVEAGLRTDDVHAPFPEEMNRRVIGVVSTYHFAPTPGAVGNMLAHGVQRNQVFYTGNTVVDALRMVKEKIFSGQLSIRDDLVDRVEECKKRKQKIMVLTAHRRESFDGGIARILSAVKKFLREHGDIFCFFALHPNPKVINSIRSVGISDQHNMYLCEPLAYKDMVYLLDAADVVLTDSGGVQEEAISLAKPVLVLREKTERMEGVLAGLARVVGTDKEKIVAGIKGALQNRIIGFSQSIHTYGDGYAADKIVGIIQARYEQNKYQWHRRVKKQKKVSNIQEKEGIAVKTVAVLGLGYIGLPTSVVLADHGLQVIGIDINEQLVASINKGDPVIHEPSIYEKLQLVLGSGTFRATTKIEQADFFIIAVPTPITKNKKADLHYVFDAAESVATVLKRGDTVIIESTISIGTTQRVADFLTQKTGMKAGNDFFVAHCPERVLPGKIFKELVSNHRIIGGINRKSVEYASQLYKLFVRGDLYLTDAKVAEMVKLIENSSRDVQLSFANQVGSMAYAVGLDPYEVIELANKHPRVNILKPTSGVGGHCIAIDPWFLIETFADQVKLLKTAREINDEKPKQVIRLIKRAVDEWRKKNDNTICVVALLGLTYKPNVDDLRESPALHIAQALLSDDSMSILIAEPHVNTAKLRNLFGDNILLPATECINNADIVVFLVNHERFKVLDRTTLKQKQVLDFCGALYEFSSNTSENRTFWPARSMMDFFIVNQGELFEQAVDEESEQ